MILVKLIKLALKSSNPDAEKPSRKNFSFRVGGRGKFFFGFVFIVGVGTGKNVLKNTVIALILIVR